MKFKQPKELTKNQIKKGIKATVCPKCGKVYRMKNLVGIATCMGSYEAPDGNYYRCGYSFNLGKEKPKGSGIYLPLKAKK